MLCLTFFFFNETAYSQTDWTAPLSSVYFRCVYILPHVSKWSKPRNLPYRKWYIFTNNTNKNIYSSAVRDIPALETVQMTLSRRMDKYIVVYSNAVRPWGWTKNIQPHPTKQMNLKHHAEGKKPDTKESDHGTHFVSASGRGRTIPWAFNQETGWLPQRGGGE